MKSHLTRYLTLLAVPAFLVAVPAMAAHQVQRAHYLQQSGQAGTRQNNELAFAGKRITVPVVAVAPGSPEKTFEIHGAVNPTIVLPAGAKVRFKLGNADRQMPHGLAVTRKSPPYPDDAKKEIKPPIAGTGYVKHENSKSGMQVAATGWFTLKPGTYYYVCPVPTHAHEGMYGKIVVKQSGS